MEKQIRAWMESNFNHSRDNNGEINYTRLAENCAHFISGGRDEWLDDESHVIWEVAIEFSDK